MTIAYVPPAYRHAVDALVLLARAKHPRGGMQTASACACGASSGGPALTEACKGIRYLFDLARAVHVRRECCYCHKAPGTTAGEYGWLCTSCAETVRRIERETAE